MTNDARRTLVVVAYVADWNVSWTPGALILDFRPITTESWCSCRTPRGTLRPGLWPTSAPRERVSLRRPWAHIGHQEVRRRVLQASDGSSIAPPVHPCPNVLVYLLQKLSPAVRSNLARVCQRNGSSPAQLRHQDPLGLTLLRFAHQMCPWSTCQ